MEQDHVFTGYVQVPDAQNLIRWIDDIVKEHLEPRPAIEPCALLAASGEAVLIINVPPSLRLIALRLGNAYEFSMRAVDSRRYLTLAEVEAHMQDRDRVHRLRLEQIDRDDPVGLVVQPADPAGKVESRGSIAG